MTRAVVGEPPALASYLVCYVVVPGRHAKGHNWGGID